MSDTDLKLPKSDQPIVYVRPVSAEKLPKKVRLAIGGLDEVYAIHSENGDYLGLAKDRSMAFALARQNDLDPVSVH